MSSDESHILQIAMVALMYSILCRKPDTGEEPEPDVHLKTNEEWLHSYNSDGKKVKIAETIAPVPGSLDEEVLAESRRVKYVTLCNRISMTRNGPGNSGPSDTELPGPFDDIKIIYEQDEGQRRPIERRFERNLT